MYVCVCVEVSYRILSLGRRGTPTFGVDVKRVYSTKIGGRGILPQFFFNSASKSSVISSSSDSEYSNESEIDVQHYPPKKHCSSSISKPPSKSGSGIRRYNKKWVETIPWLEFDENLQGAFCKLFKKGGSSLQKTGGTWITKPFTNWIKMTQEMKSHL